MKLSLTEQLILGILSEQPRHGYDIEKIIVSRGMRKWTEVGFSSIYYVLEKLELKGLATSTDAQGNEKKQYSITLLGMSTLKNETKKLITERKPANTHFMSGLATSHLLHEDEFRVSLQQRKTKLSADLKALQIAQSGIDAIPQPARRLLELSETLSRAELRFITKELRRVRK